MSTSIFKIQKLISAILCPAVALLQTIKCGSFGFTPVFVVVRGATGAMIRFYDILTQFGVKFSVALDSAVVRPYLRTRYFTDHNLNFLFFTHTLTWSHSWAWNCRYWGPLSQLLRKEEINVKWPLSHETYVGVLMTDPARFLLFHCCNISPDK